MDYNDLIDFEVMADLMADYFNIDHQDRQED